ncbi:MAG: response regulator [Deltaproteobacteria bacterium]|nr:response regulator [Deltaproteobacteria bacterium]
MKTIKISPYSSGEITTDLCFANLLKHGNEGSRSKLKQELLNQSREKGGEKPPAGDVHQDPCEAGDGLQTKTNDVSENRAAYDLQPGFTDISNDKNEIFQQWQGWLVDVHRPFMDGSPESEADPDETDVDDMDDDSAGQKNGLEEKLLNIQKMEAIGTLAGGIAHDFNNILMGIQGYISMILHDLKPDHPYRMKFENIQNYLELGADLTKQLLNFAQGENYEVKATHINDVIDKSADMFGRTKKEISIFKHFKTDLWMVDVDISQINQVFLNLFINAAQAMPGGGNLTIETDNVIFGENEIKPFNIASGKYIKISVTDDGAGMNKKTMKRIFEPFFTTKPKGIGTGLGLTSVFGIIKNHGGAIQVESKPGKGTTFKIYLPATNHHEPAIGEEQEKEIITGQETVLIVDDELINITVMKEMLEMLNYRVLCAGSGQEAVAVYMEKQHDIDIIILDMILPGMSGSQTFNFLREINPHVPVILTSGYNAKGEAKKIMDKGCNGFIQKPFHLQDLSKKIRDVLDDPAV